MRAILSATLLSLLLLTLGGARAYAQGKTELEGRWDVKDFELNNASSQLLRLFHGLNPKMKNKDRAGFLEVQDDKFMPLGNGKLRRESLGKLDVKAAPKTIDLAGTDRFLKGKTFLGIYKLNGDELTLCIGETKRPTEFTAKAGQALIRYERSKAR